MQKKLHHPKFPDVGSDAMKGCRGPYHAAALVLSAAYFQSSNHTS
jgi:hypothetical protein